MDHWLESGGILSHGIIYYLGSAKVYLPAFIEIDFSNLHTYIHIYILKDVCVALIDYYKYLLLLNCVILIGAYSSINNVYSFMISSGFYDHS